MTEQDPYETTPAPSGKEPRPNSPVSAEEWAAEFQQTHHREPTMSEYQAAVQAGAIVQERQRDQSMQQMAQGARQVASGAKDFFNSRVAPAAQGAARSMQQAVNEQRSAPQGGIQTWAGWAQFVLPVAAFLALISLFMPIASLFGYSVNFFSDELGGEGAFLLLFLLLTIGASIALIILKAKWARITTGIIGIVTSLICMIDGFGNMASIGGTSGVSVGAGLVFLSLFSVVMLVASVLILLPLWVQPAATQPPPAQPPQR